MRGQLTLEALVALSAFIALLLALVHLFIAVHSSAEEFGERAAARSCAVQTAELAGYYALDGRGSFFPLEIGDSFRAGGEIYCVRGKFNSSSETLVVEDGMEPV